MDQNQRDLRRAAAQSFLQSLGQLEETLQPSEAAVEPSDHAPASPQQTASPSSLDITALEAAAADIEQFIQGSDI
ncbi:MAG TPA: hypothetical protein V6C57_05340 [Coleofasciculaceae cyanobacterium]